MSHHSLTLKIIFFNTGNCFLYKGKQNIAHIDIQSTGIKKSVFFTAIYIKRL
jgi:hypothetical protein